MFAGLTMSPRGRPTSWKLGIPGVSSQPPHYMTWSREEEPQPGEVRCGPDTNLVHGKEK
jgi:hypothetical protein